MLLGLQGFGFGKPDLWLSEVGSIAMPAMLCFVLFLICNSILAQLPYGAIMWVQRDVFLFTGSVLAGSLSCARYCAIGRRCSRAQGALHKVARCFVFETCLSNHLGPEVHRQCSFCNWKHLGVQNIQNWYSIHNLQICPKTWGVNLTPRGVNLTPQGP